MLSNTYTHTLTQHTRLQTHIDTRTYTHCYGSANGVMILSKDLKHTDSYGNEEEIERDRRCVRVCCESGKGDALHL